MRIIEAAQARDQQVDAALERVHGAAARLLHQLVAAEDAPGHAQKGAQQAEFGVGQRHQHPLRRDQVALDGVQLPAVKAHHIVGQGLRLARRAAQHGLDARHQLARLERLGHVVVGTHLQAQHAVVGVAARGEHDDGQGRALAHLARQGDAVFTRQHEVQHQQIDAVLRHLRTHGRATVRRQGLEAKATQVVGQKCRDVGVVVHDQNGVHPSSRKARNRASVGKRLAARAANWRVFARLFQAWNRALYQRRYKQDKPP